MAGSKLLSTTPELDGRLLALDPPARLRALQAGLGLSNLEVSRGRGIYPQWISQVLNGERRSPDVVNAIADALGIPAGEVNVAVEPPAAAA